MTEAFLGHVTRQEIVTRSDNTPISLGTYKVSILKASEELYPSGAVMLDMEFRILNGKHKGTTFWASENMAYRDGRSNWRGDCFLSTLREVVGSQLGKLDELCNVPLRIEVLLEGNSRFRLRNKVRNPAKVSTPPAQPAVKRTVKKKIVVRRKKKASPAPE